MIDCIDGHYGNWQNGMFVRYDGSHIAATTHHNGRWDGTYTAPCPHGRMVMWTCSFGSATQCHCECR